MSGAPELDGAKWTAGLRYIPGEIDRAKLRLTVTYGLTPDLQIGVEANPLARDLHPLANWRALDETESRPALMFGTSSDRIGTTHGQSFYGTFSKSLEPQLGLPLAPYVGAAFGTFDRRVRAIAGAEYSLPWNLSAGIMFDGVHAHPGLTWSHRRHAVGFLLVRGRGPGVSYSIRF